METQGIKDLTIDVLESLPEPWPSDLIDLVFLRIEGTENWMDEYYALVEERGKQLVNQWISRYCFQLSDFNHSGPPTTATSSIIKTYKLLSR